MTATIGGVTNPWIQGNRHNFIWLEDTFRFKDPMMATSSVWYEGRPWWVGSRDPLVEGFKWSWSEFFGGRRPFYYAEGNVLLTALTTAVTYAYAKETVFFKLGKMSTSEVSNTGRNYRPTHPWAMRRLSALRIVRPLTLTTLWMGSYLFPRSFVEQNWGRQNQQYHFDLVPHIAGTLCNAVMTQALFGSTWRLRGLVWVFWAGATVDMHFALGGNLFESTREATYARVLGGMYGLPDGGEGYEALVDGELSSTWRLESETERGLLAEKVEGQKQIKLMDGHPYFEQDFGHHWIITN